LNKGLGAVLVALSIAALALGPVTLAPGTVLGALAGVGDETARIIVIEIRLPRLLLAVLIGATMGLSGAALQGLMRNPLADPSLFGAPQAAAFGAVLVVSFGLVGVTSFALPLAAIAGAFVSIGLLFLVAGPRTGLASLVLAGLAVSSLAGALTALVLALTPNLYAVLEIVFWLMGSLADRSFHHVAMAAPFMAVCAALLWANRHALRALALGETAAASLGVDLARLRLTIVVAVALGVGAAVAVAGAIGFIGLVAPHLARPLVRYDPARLLLPSALIGAILLVAADLVVRLLPTATDLPIGVVTALVGVPFFLALIVRERRTLGAEG
jgi:iron complex transport system permease protein